MQHLSPVPCPGETAAAPKLYSCRRCGLYKSRPSPTAPTWYSHDQTNAGENQPQFSPALAPGLSSDPPPCPALNLCGSRLDEHGNCRHDHGGTITEQRRRHWSYRPRPESLRQRRHFCWRPAARNGYLRRSRIRTRGFRRRPTLPGEWPVPRLVSYASSDACRVILAGADAALRDQRRTRRTDASIPARAQLGFAPATRLLRAPAVSASGKRGPPHYVRVGLCKYCQCDWKLGSHLRASRLSCHGHYRLGLVNLHGPHLHDCLPRSHACLRGVETPPAGLDGHSPD